MGDILLIKTIRKVLFGLMFLTAWLSPHDSRAAGCTAHPMTVRGTSLMPLVRPGTPLQVWPRGCAPLAPGRLAVYRTAAASDRLVIKRIAARPGRVLKLTRPASGFAYTVYVDGLAARAPDGAPYVATDRGARLLKLYEGPLKGYLLLGRPGSLDAGRVAVQPATAILGTATVPGRGHPSADLRPLEAASGQISDLR